MYVELPKIGQKRLEEYNGKEVLILGKSLTFFGEFDSKISMWDRTNGSFLITLKDGDINMNKVYIINRIHDRVKDDIPNMMNKALTILIGNYNDIVYEELKTSKSNDLRRVWEDAILVFYRDIKFNNLYLDDITETLEDIMIVL